MRRNFLVSQSTPGWAFSEITASRAKLYILQTKSRGAGWLSGRVLDSRLRPGVAGSSLTRGTALCL